MADGSITSSVTGGTTPYTYLWSSGATTANISSLSAATYTITVTDANAKTATASATITSPTSLSGTATTVINNVSCNGDADGSASISPSGGTPSYTYLWSNGETTATATMLSAGTSTVTVTDANGCTLFGSATITEPSVLNATSTATNPSCSGSDGSATVSASGGTSPYTYLWSNAATTTTITSLMAGTYTATVTDNNGCTATITETLATPVSGITASVSKSDAICFGDATGSATASASGGSTPYTYNWNTGGTTATISSLPAGTYSVTVTDNNGCTDSASATVGQSAAITPSPSATDVSCLGAGDGAIDLTTSGGVAPYTYLWSNTATTEDLTNLSGGVYTVTVTDGLGCTATANSTITEPTAIFATLTSDSDVSCNGAADGTIDISVTGGTAAYTYLWSNSATTEDISSLAGGTYTVTITDANSCTTTLSNTISEPTAIAISMSSTDATTNGGSDGTATASPSGGSTPYTYLWSNSATTATITNLVAGTYSVTVTDANGCTDSASTTVSQPAALSASITVDSNVSCNGFLDGGASTSVTGGTSPYSFLWSNSASTASITGVSAGVYTVTVTDNGGATATAVTSITEPTILNATLTTDVDVSCNGGTDGMVGISNSGGTLPYTYLWSDGQTAATATGLAAGTYTVTLTDNNGCTRTLTNTISEPTAINISFSSNNVTFNGGSDGDATATVSGGTPSYTYLWSNGNTTSMISSLVAGTYSITVTDGNGCTNSSSVVITEPAVLNVATTVDSNVSCNGFTDGGATASSTSGVSPFTYNWSNMATTASITGVSAGTYTVTVTDNNGTTGTNTVLITEPALLVSTTVIDSNVSCNGFLDGGATASAVGGTMPYTYNWSNSATTASITGVASGTYSVTVTDANGCTDSSSVTISEPAVLTSATVVDSNVSCNSFSDGGSTASATGGTMPYTYAWSNSATTASITGVAAGTYSVTVTDNNGCTDSSSVTITEPAALAVGAIVDSNVSCNAFLDGGATAAGTGGTMPYNYLWSNGATTASITGVAAGTYTVSVSDANNCGPATTTVTINEPAALVIATVADSNASCNGFTDGGASSIALGGTMPYTYLWSNGATTGNITGIGAGTYSVTLSDANGCTDSSSVTITEPTVLVASSTVDSNVSCNGFLDGGATASATGGTGAYTFNWSNGATTASITGIAGGTYTVTVSDANGCTSTVSSTITEPATLAISTTINSNATCNGGSDGNVTASATGGTMPYSYLWSSGTTSATAGALTAGSYTVTVTDANGCSGTDNVTITEPTAVTVSAVVNANVSCNGFADGAATATAAGGTAPYTYLWSNTSNNAFNGALLAGVYSVSVADANGCTNGATTSVTITEPPALVTTTVVDSNVSCNGFANGGITTTTTGGVTPYTYTWSNGGSTASITGLTAGVYTVTVTDANGCTLSDQEVITQPTVFSGSASLDNDVSCFGLNDGAATATAIGGTMPYTYTWSNGATSASISAVVAGTYSVTMTDANGCTDDDSVVISEPTALVSTANVTSDVSCNGLSDGSATSSAAGGTMPYSYVWSNGSTTASISGLTAGAYTVTVTDANACTDVSSITVTEPTALVVGAGVDNNVSCSGTPNGAATGTASGGTSPYTFTWSNGASTASITNLFGGTYTVTVTDANGCSDTASVTVTEPTILLAAASVDNNVSCFGLSDGGATASASGGTTPYSFVWSNSATTATISSVMAGTYTVTVTDANGCTSTRSIAIAQPAMIDTSVVKTQFTLTSNQSGATYQWLDCNNGFSPIAGATQQAYTADDNGDFAVEITIGGCVDTSACIQVIGVGLFELNRPTAELKVYPNPSKGLITIDFDGSIDNQQMVQIFSLKGQMVYEGRMESSLQNIDLTNLDNGIYFIRYQNHIKKLVLSR